MKQDELLEGARADRRSARSGKQPYERPQITYREPLEAVAAFCGPPFGKPVAPCVAAQS